MWQHCSVSAKLLGSAGKYAFLVPPYQVNLSGSDLIIDVKDNTGAYLYSD